MYQSSLGKELGIIKLEVFCYYIDIQIQDAIQPVEIAMRNLLYSMISAEGTYKSQKVCV